VRAVALRRGAKIWVDCNTELWYMASLSVCRDSLRTPIQQASCAALELWAQKYWTSPMSVTSSSLRRAQSMRSVNCIPAVSISSSLGDMAVWCCPTGQA